MSDDEDYYSEESDTESTNSLADINVPQTENLEEVIEEMIDSLTEKSSGAREKSLKSIRKLILVNSGLDILERRSEIIMESSIKCLKRGGETERKSAAELITSMFYLIGPDNEEVYRTVFPTLKDAIRDHKSDSTKVACLKSLTFDCFLSSTEDSSTVEALTLFEEIFSKNSSPQVMAAATNSWALLASTISNEELSNLTHRVIKTFKKNLGSTDYGLRISSGIAIAFLSENMDEASFKSVITDDLLDKIEELSRDSDKRKGKKEKNKQRSMFREILQTLENGTTQIEKLNLKGGSLVVDSWSKLIRLNALRDILGTTFNSHIQSNQTVRDMFDMSPVNLADVNQKMSSEEKRQYRSQAAEASKQRNISRSQKRQTKMSRTLVTTED